MKILYSWLKDFIDIDLPAQELADKLGALGIEIAETTKTGVDFEGVFTAKVLKLEKHPNADKLNLVTVDTGKGQKTIVCGAQNLEVGIIVPLAHDGARLGKNILKAAEIRGIKSDGMICSSDELGLTSTRQKGILHMDPSLPPGVDVSTLYPKADYIFDLEITSNRPDLLSHLGVARELSIALGIPLKKPQAKEVKEEGKAMPVKIHAPQACNRYSGRIVSGVKNAASPEWMQTRLSAMGVNPKNALVDISNYVLYDIGQPLHFFNLSAIEGGEINVRMAAEGEEFTTLDGNKVNLVAADLVIADAKKGVCLAGVMGGLNSGIEDNTTDIFIEAAYFDPPAINRTAKKYGYSSESSQRFERGTDVSLTMTALDRATNLVQELCGGTASVSTDQYPVVYEPADVIFSAQDIAKILGVEIEEEKLKQIFSSLGARFETELKEWIFVSPQHRRDLNHKWDLAEEAARFAGFDVIPVSETRATVAFSDNPKNVDVSAKFSSALISLGFCECKNFDFVSAKDVKNFGFDLKNAVEIANPLNEDWQYMRPSLFGGLLRNASYNQHRNTRDYMLFETGKEYQLMKGFPGESWVCAGIISGGAGAQSFNVKPIVTDFYYVKGIVETVLKDMPGVSFSPSKNPASYMHPKVCMDILLDGKQTAGFFGALHPLTLKEYDVKGDNVLAFYLNTKILEKRFSAQDFKPASDVVQYPSSYRDLSFIVTENISYADVEKALNSAGIFSQFSYKLIDMYQGEKLGEGKKSLTLSFAFWLMDRTLKDVEVEDIMNKIISALSSIGAQLR